MQNSLKKKQEGSDCYDFDPTSWPPADETQPWDLSVRPQSPTQI